eukprot:COSAG01_NODE_172_length_23108_cov_26.690496_12_plen_75_part_00
MQPGTPPRQTLFLPPPPPPPQPPNLVLPSKLHVTSRQSRPDAHWQGSASVLLVVLPARPLKAQSLYMYSITRWY